MLDQSFWSDPDIEATKSGVKLAALWLITNSQTSLLGICGASPSRFEFETGLPAKALQSALEALPRSFKKFGSCIFVRNYIRHQFGSGEKLMRNNFFVALKSLFVSVKDEEMKAFILAEYPEFNEALTKGLEGLTKPKLSKGKERKGGEESPERGGGVTIPKEIDTPEFKAAWAGYIEFRKASKMKPFRAMSVEAKFREFSKWGLKLTLEAIEHSIANGYQGVFKPKPSTPSRNGRHAASGAECPDHTDTDPDKI